MTTNRITAMLDDCWSGKSHFPRTDLFNEGWMLRLVLDWLAQQAHDSAGSPLPSRYDWYSEARLPSAFLPRYRGDRKAESHTHADGVIGDFDVGSGSSTELRVPLHSSVLAVIEAKMFSGLSQSTTHAPNYDQAARTVACMTEVLRRGDRAPADMQRLSFHVVAPQQQIDTGVFEDLVTRKSIREKVEARLADYDDPMDRWKNEWFEPLLEQAEIGLLSWEEVLAAIEQKGTAAHGEFASFYEQCLSHGGSQA